MRSAGNFHPEWGYLAPAPSFMRTVRVALIATAIGAVAGAVVVVSLIARPGSNDEIAAHALLTRAPVVATRTAATPQSSAPAKGPANVPAAAIPATAPAKPQQTASTVTQLPRTSAGPVQAPAATPAPSRTDGHDGPEGSIANASPPLPLAAPSDAAVAEAAPAEAVPAPDRTDAAVAPEAAPAARAPAKRATRRRHYEPYGRYEPYDSRESGGGGPRQRWRNDGGFQPLFRLFSFRAGSPYSSN